MEVADEFNKYLSYVRNLGFEDTPDYDYLRDLFTQALKNAGEVEDGEYDWMKLNGGRGWEYKPPYSSQHQLNSPLATPGRDMHGAQLRNHKAGVTADRLNAAQPPPPAQKPGPGRVRERQSGIGGTQGKRVSGVFDGGAGTPQQYPSPSATQQHRMSSHMVNSMQAQPHHGHGHGHGQGHGHTHAPQPSHESQPNMMQKVMKVLCCGKL